MPQYMLLLYHDASHGQAMSPEEMQKAVEKYIAWTKKPFMVDSKRLAPDAGRVIRAQGGRPRATDGPYSETKEILGVHIIGEGASELLHIGQAVMALKGTMEYFVDTVFNYPTLAECYKAAAFNGLNKLSKF